MPRVWVGGSLPPLGIARPAPDRVRPTKRLATPVRLSWPTVATLAAWTGVIPESLMSSSTSARPLPVSVIAPTLPT